MMLPRFRRSDGTSVILRSSFCLNQRPARRSSGDKECSPRPFKDIPGPRPLPIIGTLYKYLPVIGEYSFTKLHKSGEKKLRRYGPLVREEMVPGVPVVWVFRPDDIAEIFKSESGKHPERRSHLALLKYRKDRHHIYNTGGLLPTNGIEWWRIRREFQKVLSKPLNVLDYLEDTDMVVREFEQILLNEKINDMLPELSRLFLELTCLVAFDVRMQSLSKEERAKNSKTTKLIEAAYTTNSTILGLDNGPRIWRFLETPLYRKMRKAQNFMEEIAVAMVSRKTRDPTIKRKQSLLDTYLSNPNLDEKDVVGMACDMLLAGIDTTTYSSSFALYHLAKNPQAQEKVRQESTNLLPNVGDPITGETLKQASYTKAVLKETFRLNPISVGVGRILQTDVVLSGYNVPKGTVVVTQNQVTCRLDEYFENPNAFLPERWIRDNSERVSEKIVENSIHPYLVLPFGHGPRSCIARRFAEQNMQVLLLRMCRSFKFKWLGENLDCDSLLINKPNGPIKLKYYSINNSEKLK
ncbi:cytochrome P450 302a1, mitochondrial [Prorops nasuta]|uniref:cytochrome P450 302a1, mitochondrial n=1 Tax=Prorops nasuta TaxID=863751 RepID=UPI0034CE9063